MDILKHYAVPVIITDIIRNSAGLLKDIKVTALPNPIQADWKENDPKNKSFIRNKPIVESQPTILEYDTVLFDYTGDDITGIRYMLDGEEVLSYALQWTYTGSLLTGITLIEDSNVILTLTLSYTNGNITSITKS